MRPNSFLCPMCHTEVVDPAMVAHIPQCYRKYCASIEMVPLCTCDNCLGKQTHPAHDQHGVKRMLPVTKLELDERDEPKRTRHDITSAPTSSGTISLRELTGKTCVICQKSRSPSALALPFLLVGQHRKLMVCKKTHLTEPGERLLLSKRLGEILNSIKIWGDVVIDDLTQVTTTKEIEASSCAGWTVAIDGERCGKYGHHLLSLEHDKIKENFCCESHLISYLVIKFAKQGGRKSKEKQTSTEKEAELGGNM